MWMWIDAGIVGVPVLAQLLSKMYYAIKETACVWPGNHQQDFDVDRKVSNGCWPTGSSIENDVTLVVCK